MNNNKVALNIIAAALCLIVIFIACIVAFNVVTSQSLRQVYKICISGEEYHITERTEAINESHKATEAVNIQQIMLLKKDREAEVLFIGWNGQRYTMYIEREEIDFVDYF